MTAPSITVLAAQPTPNPDAIKFVTNVRLSARGAKSFEEPAAAASDPLAAALFAAGPVASVFILDRFVTVTKFPTAEWGDLEPRLRAAVESQTPPDSGPSERADTAPGADLLARITKVLDETIRPGLAGDGGGLEILGLEGFVLSIHYQGACGSCPSAASGTLYAIESLLQERVDPRLSVLLG